MKAKFKCYKKKNGKQALLLKQQHMTKGSIEKEKIFYYFSRVI
jgi:hypothetical protein